MVKDTSSGYLQVRKFTSSGGEKIKTPKRLWGLEYNGRPYINLFYSTDLILELFVPFDITGRYCVIIVNENTPKVVRNGGGAASYGTAAGVAAGGLIGGAIGGALTALLKNPAQWGKGWKDRDGKKYYLLFTDTFDIQDGDWDRTPSSHINFLSKKQLRKLCAEQQLEVQDTDEMLFEDVVDLIRKLNEKQ